MNPGEIPDALADVAAQQLSNALHAPVKSLLGAFSAGEPLQNSGESPLDAALRIVKSMSGGCLVIQGPPGTGKNVYRCLHDRCLAGRGKKRSE